METSISSYIFFLKCFWYKLFPSIVPPHGSAILLALQLSCNVLVIACPYALGLATPTIVLVGNSLGAIQGLLICFGDILEKFSLVDIVVFDKTGTLTTGRPVVTKVFATGNRESDISFPNDVAIVKKSKLPNLSELEIFKLAVVVEANTMHPITKAIMQATRSAGCKIAMVKDGTFEQEPRSGATVIMKKKRFQLAH